MLKRLLGLGGVAVFFVSTPVFAQDIFDIIVQQNDEGQLVTGVPDFDNVTGSQANLTRVFEFEFGDTIQSPDPFEVNNPGFNVFSNSSPALPVGTSALTPGELLFVDFVPAEIDGVVSNLFYWDGLDGDDAGTDLSAADVDFGFGPEFDGYGLTIENLVGSRATATGADEFVPGVAIDRIDSVGALHRHPDYFLTTGDGSAPAEGVYLVPLQVRQEGLETSEPFFLLFGTLNSDIDATGAAAAFLIENIDSIFSDDQPGDFNFDETVNAADFVVFRDGAATPGTGLEVFDEFAANFGTEASQAGATVTSFAVPEPATGLGLGLAWILGVAIARRRR